jgi:hypothetical protein
MATLGPTVREFSNLERAKTSRERVWSEQRLRVRERTRLHETSRVRLREKTSRARESTVREIESRRFESSRVREFELDSGVIPTVKSEANKESERLSGWVCYFPTSTAITVQYIWSFQSCLSRFSLQKFMRNPDLKHEGKHKIIR